MSADPPPQASTRSDAAAQQTSDLTGLTAAIGLDGNTMSLGGDDPLLNAEIGGVRIVRTVAEGGMGRVYEGLQDKPRRPVAVKVMRPGFVSREACRRFDNESEVLGRLRHQYIAQIYSAGICTILGAQVPYFVMEFIPDALPITKYAADRKLSTNERVELFRKVCEAVAHGHKNNVIHRDLKPSNILVEPNGVPKVIDFGVARCVDASAEALTALTDMGQLIGTVQYMSPEQFSGNPTDVDVRADVYALGVILYELLSGKPPYEITQKQIFEAAKVVREQKPVSPAKHNQSVRPDLVRITDTCLHKDRDRRYASAAELVTAIGSYLDETSQLRPSRSSWSACGNAIVRRCNVRSTVKRLRFAMPLLGIAAFVLWWLQRPDSLALPVQQPEIQFHDHTYRVFLEPATQAEAIERCRKQGGYLAQIDTAAENTAILAAALNSEVGQGYLWIAGYRPAGSSDWLVETRKEPLGFFHRGIDRLNTVGDGPHALVIAVDGPIAYWQSLSPAVRTAGFICEWNDEKAPRGRNEP